MVYDDKIVDVLHTALVTKMSELVNVNYPENFKLNIANIKIVGDVPSPIRAEFKNESVNPKLTLVNTGEFIKVQTTIADEEKLIINTAYGNKTVEHIAVDGTIENAYHLITLDSSFFSLPIGENQLSFIGESGTPEVYLYWRNYYVGV